MKLFDLNNEQFNNLKKVIYWHMAYIALIALFFTILYYGKFFKSHPFLRESPLFNFFAPFCTIIFVIISPWRLKWLKAIYTMYLRLDKEPVFCVMAAFLFFVGFYTYSVFLWGLGAIGPSLFYM